MTASVAIDDPDAGAEPVELRPTREQTNQRLDRFVADALPDLSRSYVQSLIESGRVKVDGVVRRAAFKMTPGEVVTVEVPPPSVHDLEPEAIPLAILFEDDDVIVLDKPAGLVVHPAPGHPRGTLVNALLAHAPGISVGGTTRPGIVHRLDKDTSGLMVVAKTDRALNALVSQWEARSVEKGYVALVAGLVEPDQGTVDAPIGRDPNNRQRMAVEARGRSAVTHFDVRRRISSATLLDVGIETGRTHQIRVHLAFIGHPVAGDAVYGGPSRVDGVVVPRQFLHAARLAFRLPGARPVAFEAPLPPDLRAVLDALERRGDDSPGKDG
ncbi:MAG: RluA family pseudouridine synthase [Chloroflexota bacterium]|nr:RluA family pseudouridine synthase [Chloroflexota bacterium]